MTLNALRILSILLILENGSCNQPEGPGVEPENTTHLLVSWKDFGGSKNSEYLDRYAIVLDEIELPEQTFEHDSQNSAFVNANPCHKHNVAMRLSFDDHPVYEDKGKDEDEAFKTKEAHYNDPDKIDFLYFGLLKEGVKTLCKKDNNLVMRDFPEDIRQMCIKNFVEGKDNRSIFFNIINPDEKDKERTICIKGTKEVFQCIDNGSTKQEMFSDQILEHVSMKHCKENHTRTKKSRTTGATVIGLVASFLFLATLGFLGFWLKKRKQRTKANEEVVDEDENPVYGLYEFQDGEVTYTTAEVTDANEVYGQ